MRNNGGIRIVKASPSFSSTPGGYDYTHSYMQGYELDLARKTATLLRQSRKGADEDNPESRLRQEGLGRIAVEIRADHDSLMILPCDEGSGVSGQKKIYERPKLLELWRAIQDGIVGSVIVAREDRLFRDRFLTQATQFAEECAKRGVLLIVAGRRCYDFRISDDFNAFIRKMQESYGYIDTHVRYMIEMKAQKRQRGEFIGGGLPSPYVLDRHAILLAREQRRLIKEYGGGEGDEAAITQAFRPIIYQSWHPIAVDLFQKFKLFDFSPSRIGRYIEDKKCLFPLPTAEDMQLYIFRACMKLVPGRGYTFGSTPSLSRWMTNLAHLGYANAGKDSDGNQIYIEGAFEADIERELFEECYEGFTGLTLEGKPGRTPVNRSRFTRKNPTGKAQALLAQCFSSPDDTIGFRVSPAGKNKAYYIAVALPRVASNGEYNISRWDHNSLWSLPVHPFDRAIVNRLADLAEHDKELAGRVEKYYKELTESQAAEKVAIVQDIERLEALIAHYDRLITNPAQPLTEAQEKRYLQNQADAERELERVQNALRKYGQQQPGEFIPAFYRILGEAPGEFWNLDVDRQRRMLRLLVDSIEIESISPHLYSLRLKWKDPVAQPWDSAFVFRRSSLRSLLMRDEWTVDDLKLLKELYPTASKLELLKTFPAKSGNAIKYKATTIPVQREVERSAPHCIVHRALCYADWVNCCKALNVDHESEERMKVLEQLNYLARATEGRVTENNTISFWWLLPVVEMNNFDETLTGSGRSVCLPDT